MRPRATTSRLTRALAAATVICLVAGAIEAATIRLFRVAIRGRLALPGASYLLFGDIDIDSLGRVLYTASLTDGRSVIFREDRGTVVPLAFSYDAAPGADLDRLQLFIEVSGNAAGDVAFIGTTFFAPGQHLFLMRNGAITRIASTGDAAPAPPDMRFLGFDQVRMLDDGTIYFSAGITGLAGESRGIYRHRDQTTHAAIVPGRRYFGARAVHETLQYDVNEAGSVAALTLVTDADLLLPPAEYTTEMVLESGGVLQTLAATEFTLAGGIESVRNFAITFDQVKVDDADGATFYASTTEHLRGGVFVNATGGFLDNARAVAQGDSAPTVPGDRFLEFGPFDRNAAGVLVFTATTDRHPGGGFFLQAADGSVETLGLIGDERPGGIGLWTGFLMAEINENDAFVVTDRDGLIQTGVFRGRLVPGVPDRLEAIRALGADPGLEASIRAGLRRRIVTLIAASRRGEGQGVATQAMRLREWLAMQGDRADPVIAIRLDILLDDLISLTAPNP
jgi:hypothetical protein